MPPAMQFAVDTHQVKCKRAALSYVGQDTGWTDQRVTVTVKALPTVLYSSLLVIARASADGQNMYALELVKGTGGCYLQLYAVYHGTYNTLWAQADPGSGSTVEVGHTITLDVTGTTITAASDGESGFVGTNTLVVGGTYAGIGMSSTTARLDDFSVLKSTGLETLPEDPPPLLDPETATDHFVDAVDPLAHASGTITWNNTGYDAGDEAVSGGICTFDGWILVQPTKACTLVLNTYGSALDTSAMPYDAQLVIWQLISDTVSTANLMRIASNDDDVVHGSGDPDQDAAGLSVALRGGLTYYIQVGTHGGKPPTTSSKLSWSGLDLTDPPDPVHARNDLIANAQVISGTGQDVPYSNYDYGMEVGEPTAHYRSSWYTFVPTANGNVHLDSQLTGPSYSGGGINQTSGGLVPGMDTYLALFTGPAGATVTDLSSVAADDDSGGSATSLLASVAVIAGQHYYVQLTMYQSTAWSPGAVLRWVIP